MESEKLNFNTNAYEYIKWAEILIFQWIIDYQLILIIKNEKSDNKKSGFIYLTGIITITPLGKIKLISYNSIPDFSSISIRCSFLQSENAYLQLWIKSGNTFLYIKN